MPAFRHPERSEGSPNELKSLFYDEMPARRSFAALWMTENITIEWRYMKRNFSTLKQTISAKPQTLVLASLFSLFSTSPLMSKTITSAKPLTQGFANIPFVSEKNLKKYQIAPPTKKEELISSLCRQLNEEYRRYRWNDEPCGQVTWKADLMTEKGIPLIYAEFGSGPITTLFLGGVHPDEITPIHISFRFAKYLLDNPTLYQDKGFKIVIAPIVNPDGFFLHPPIRTNERVDVNRNFLTMDWYQNALDAWVTRRKSHVRYFPGYFPNTEIETYFQVQLIETYHPDKIFSLHAPLGFYDYDGPGDQKPRYLSATEQKAREFVESVAEKSQNYRIVDYSFYPGSLGNYAGNERFVPTITLELESIDPKYVNTYWEKFLPGFIHSIEYRFKSSINVN